MTALPTPEPESAPVIPYADATPAQLREAILPEDVEKFDDALQRAANAMVTELSLIPVWEFLEHWRRLARSANHNGHDHWRTVLARADYTLATGGLRAPVDANAIEVRRLIEEHAGRNGR